MLETTLLSKSFGPLKALDAVSVGMNAGQAVALVGPNGSGKTTFLKCLLGLVLPDSGTLTLRGQSILGTWDYRQHIGYMPQIGRYPDHVRVGQVLEMIQELRRGTYTRLDDDLLRAFGVAEFAHKQMRTLSGGTRQKVSACLAFLFDPDVLVLDEPTAGLDPVASEILKEKVLAEQQRGKLVLVTSHILSDLEDLTTDVLYLIEGKVQFYQSIQQLKARTGEDRLNRALAQVMQKMLRIVKYVLYDILHNRIVIGYTLFLLAVSLGLFNLSGDPTKGLVSLLNVVLIVTPLVSIVFATIHFYNASEFIELLAAQPIRRSVIVWSQFAGLATALTLAVLLGVGLPVALYAPGATGFTLTVAAVGLSLVFVAVAVLASVLTRDKAKGIGVALLLWFYFALLYDALVLFLMFSFADYPLEKAMLAVVALNPIDLARVVVLLQMDISALMGYTGALFREFLGTGWGIAGAVGVLLLWVGVPIGWAVRVFRRKDL